MLLVLNLIILVFASQIRNAVLDNNSYNNLRSHSIFHFYSQIHTLSIKNPYLNFTFIKYISDKYLNIQMAFDIINLVLHLDVFIETFVKTHGLISYLILFAIIFLETGLVFTPFFPGDTLIFIAGTLAATGNLNLTALFFIFIFAAILGDSTNYLIGDFFGARIRKSKYLHSQIKRTEEFYKKHGGKTIVYARFMPIIRTMAPFVAGISLMNYPRFLKFNISGGIVWVSLSLFSGYFFGQIPWVKEHLNLIIWLLALTTFIPPTMEYLYNKFKSKS